MTSHTNAFTRTVPPGIITTHLPFTIPLAPLNFPLRFLWKLNSPSRRALWLSTSTDLHADASRDLRDLGAHLRVINNVGALDRESRALGLSREYQEGVLFM